jgi:energy-coupling factor transporter ATP-binding protein EcfA2
VKLEPTVQKTNLFKWPRILRSERVAFLGPTGSGKSVLAKALIASQKNVIIVDTKRKEDWSDVAEIVSERDVFRCGRGRYVFRVPRDFLIDPSLPEKFFRWALDAGGRVIYVDELLDIIPTPGLKILATQGRAAGVGLWTATQRPSGVPLYTISETQHMFVFYLRLERDRERIEDATSGSFIPWDKMRQPKYQFVHVDESGDVSGPTFLKI